MQYYRRRPYQPPKIANQLKKHKDFKNGKDKGKTRKESKMS
jgi:hypothetical protein